MEVLEFVKAEEVDAHPFLKVPISMAPDEAGEKGLRPAV